MKIEVVALGEGDIASVGGHDGIAHRPVGQGLARLFERIKDGIIRQERTAEERLLMGVLQPIAPRRHIAQHTIQLLLRKCRGFVLAA